MTGRRRATTLGGLAAVIVAVAVLAAVRSNGAPNGASGPGVSAFVSRPLTSFVAVSRDGRTLTTFAYRGPCGEPIQNRLVAVETAKKVTLTLLVHRLTRAQADQTACALAVFYPPSFPSVRIAAPLGRRALVQGFPERPLPTYGGSTIATPAVLPMGCRLGRIRPATDILTNGPPYPRGFHPGVTWSCGVTVPYRPATFGPASLLTFGQWQGRVGGVGLPVEMRTTVHGQPALVKVEGFGSLAVVQERSIEWFEQGQSFVITSVTNLEPSVSHTGAVLSAAELIRVAEGLRV